MSNIKEKKSEEDKEQEEKNLSSKMENTSSFKNLKKIRKDLMSFAKDEISNIKKSKKDISVAHFEQKELIAPNKYSVTTKKLAQSHKKYNSNFEPVEEKNDDIKKDKDKKVENIRNDKNEVSSSDISDDDDE